MCIFCLDKWGHFKGLTKAGFNVTVFERDEGPQSRAQGYRISIRSLGLAALASLLSPERLKDLESAKIAAVGDGVTFADEKMNVLFQVPSGQSAAIQFLRSELRKVLQKGVQVEWNKHAVSFEERDDQVIVYFKDGTQAQGDLLVACDGAGSTIRKLLPAIYGNKVRPLPEIIDTPRVVFGGQIDRTPEWEKLLPLNMAGLVRYSGPNSVVLGLSFSERADRSPTILWMISENNIDTTAQWLRFDDSLKCRQALLHHCQRIISLGGWHENLQKLINETQAEGIVAPWLLRTTRFPNSMEFPLVPSGRITLLGDAAHAMPPDRGLGGNNVLEDARLLTEILIASPHPINWAASIAEYEQHMFVRAQAAVKESEEAAKN